MNEKSELQQLLEKSGVEIFPLKSIFEDLNGRICYQYIKCGLNARWQLSLGDAFHRIIHLIITTEDKTNDEKYLQIERVLEYFKNAKQYNCDNSIVFNQLYYP